MNKLIIAFSILFSVVFFPYANKTTTENKEEPDNRKVVETDINLNKSQTHHYQTVKFMKHPY